jgi:hypothetical protein
MPYVMDFHTHSIHSDGALPPADLVASAQDNDLRITHMALTDHNTFAGCRVFLDACRVRGIEGFVSAEISGSHPEYPHVEFHFLTTFGNQWTNRVAARIELFTAYLNRLSQVETQNIFLFLHAAAAMGILIPYRRVVEKAVEDFLPTPLRRGGAPMRTPSFDHLRQVMRQRGLTSRRTGDLAGLIREVWARDGARPLPTPPITEAYAAFQDARPAAVLAHPMTYGLSLGQLRPLIEQWRQRIRLVGLEAHYRGELYPQWAALARELGLLVAVGSDMHKAYDRPADRCVPVVEDGEANVPALLTVLRAAGDPPPVASGPPSQSLVQ